MGIVPVRKKKKVESAKVKPMKPKNAKRLKKVLPDINRMRGKRVNKIKKRRGY
jgi:hypothetical protein|tara:strand:- start:5960 stop:6118 length:159 start_codon:yes stop_codon:yes gene_type:complete